MSEKPVLAFYIRLSLEDRDKQERGIDESGSISHQRDLLEAAYRSREELAGYETTEYVDDGYSGTNFDRPSFQRMMKDVRTGIVKCIMVKDFSRFARNFLDAGEYLEQIFPFLGVRFISVNDHYDSEEKEHAAGDWDVVFKNFLYDLYSKDLSKKVVSAQKTKLRKGEYLGKPPIGYVRSKTVKNHLEIEPMGAKIVRHVFDLALEGSSIGQIAEQLNFEKIPTPGEVAETVHVGKTMFCRKNESVICWNHAMVSAILKNRVYTGAVVGYKRSKIVACGKDRRANAESDWIIVPGCHEAIVTEEEYVLARERSRTVKHYGEKKRQRPRRTILSDYIVCGYCNKKMVYAYRSKSRGVFYCKTTLHAPMEVTDTICDKRKYEVDEIERRVFTAIKQLSGLARNRLLRLKMKQTEAQETVSALALQIQKDEQTIEHKKLEKKEAYERYVNETISREDFLCAKKKYDEELTELENRMNDWKRKLREQQPANEEETKTLETLADYFDASELSREMVEALVNRVILYRDHKIEIEWNFKDLFFEI